MENYIVSARKYRPSTFESVVGQRALTTTLKNAIATQKLAHAYLFCGPRGVGKTTCARIFAKTINCMTPTADGEACNQCESCVAFNEQRSYNIHELDAASNNGVDDIKALMDQVRIPPQIGKYSVYIIDEVHMLSQSAFNAFLKTLEEPPAHAIFILATTEKHKILPTILSRCQTYDFNRITVDNIVRNLKGIAEKENIHIDEESLHVIAHKADGAMRDALTIFDQTVAFCGADVKYQDVLKNLNVLDYEHCFDLVDYFLKGDYPSAFLKFDEILAKGFNALHFIAALSSHLRDLAVSKNAGLEALLDLPESLKKKYKEQAERCSIQFIYEALGITTSCETGYRASINPRLHIEFALMKLCYLTGKPQQETADRQIQQTAVTETPHKEKLLETRTEIPVTPVGKDTNLNTSQTTQEEPEQTSPPATARRSRQARTAASALSLKAMMDSSKDALPSQTLNTNDVTDDKMPDDDTIRLKWKEMAALYSSKPRLANTLSSSKLEITEEDGAKYITFCVMNVAQKDWIETKLLLELEGTMRKITESGKLYLRVSVIPDDEMKQTIYMPSEQARDLMSKNEEVKNLVAELGLDVK